ncbi:MAG: hypothetical protein QM811_28180 [Pirellulales bacterium]
MAAILPYAFAIFVTLQSLGLGCTLVSRMAIGTSCQGLCHGVFMVLLLLIGCCTFASLWAGSALWLVSGMNLGTMVIAAVHDPANGAVARS